MKALVEGFMSRQPVAYILFGVGAVIAVVMEMLGVPALIFALGMYLPLELNTPALVGGFVSHLVNKRATRRRRAGARIRERGVIIACGLMAGGALGGVFGAGLPPASKSTPKIGSRRRSTTTNRFRRSFPQSCSSASVLYLWFGARARKGGCMMDQFRRTDWRRDSRHRHALGRRRDVRLRHRTLHRRLLVLATSRCPPPTPSPPRRECARPAASAAKTPDRDAVDAYLAQVDIPGAIAGIASEAARLRRPARRISRRPGRSASRPCGTSPWRSSAKVPPCPTRAASIASTGKPPEPPTRSRKRERVAELLGRAGMRPRRRCWPRSMPGAKRSASPWRPCRLLGAAVIGHFDSPQRARTSCRTCRPNCTTCRAPTSNSCRSKTPGSPAR